MVPMNLHVPKLSCAEICTHAVVQLIIALTLQCKRLPPEEENTIHCLLDECWDGTAMLRFGRGERYATEALKAF